MIRRSSLMGGATIASRFPAEVKAALARYTSPSADRSRATRVRYAIESVYVRPEIEAVLREELRALPAYAARQPGGRALLLQPHASARALAADVAHLTATRLYAEGHTFRGDIVCAPQALPIESESFQLVFA